MKPLVLVIEDDPAIRRFLRANLIAEEFRFIEAETAEQGISEASARQPDLILLDLGLPDKDGLEWVTATPKTKDGQVQTVRIGFRTGNLAALDILDSFGQTSRMSFSGFAANVLLDATAFQFKPPAGADVMRQ